MILFSEHTPQAFWAGVSVTAEFPGPAEPSRLDFRYTGPKRWTVANQATENLGEGLFQGPRYSSAKGLADVTQRAVQETFSQGQFALCLFLYNIEILTCLDIHHTCTHKHTQICIYIYV